MGRGRSCCSAASSSMEAGSCGAGCKGVKWPDSTPLAPPSTYPTCCLSPWHLLPTSYPCLCSLSTPVPFLFQCPSKPSHRAHDCSGPCLGTQSYLWQQQLWQLSGWSEGEAGARARSKWQQGEGRWQAVKEGEEGSLQLQLQAQARAQAQVRVRVAATTAICPPCKSKTRASSLMLNGGKTPNFGFE